MREMEGKYHFKASRKQYNTKISQWRIGKNVKTSEMRAIVRKTRERKMENPPKASVFRVRSRPVDPDKIERFKKDKVIGEVVVMADAATPSDISCITPQPSDCASTEQSPHPLFGGSSINPFSPVQRTASSSYQPILSSDLPVVSSNPAFCQLDAGQPSPLHNPDLSHRLPFGSPHLSRHSPVYWRWSLSPLPDSAQISRFPLSPYVGHQAISSLTDPFLHPIAAEPAVSELEMASAFASYSDRSRSSSRTTSGKYIADVVRGLIRQIDTYEGQKQHERLEANWSLIKTHLDVDESEWFGCCDVCMAWLALIRLEVFLHKRDADPDFICHNIHRDFPISDCLRALLSGIESDGIAGLELCQSTIALLFDSGRHQDGESVARAIIHEMERRTSLDIDIKGSVTLALAETLTEYGRHEKAEQLVQDVLKGDFGAIARMAAGASFSNIEVKKFDGEIIDIRWADGPELTAEELEDIKAMLGEERTPRMPFYFKALSFLSKLNAHCVEEVTDDPDI